MDNEELEVKENEERREEWTLNLYHHIIGLLLHDWQNYQDGLSDMWTDTDTEFIEGNYYVYIPAGDEVFNVDTMIDMAEDPAIPEKAVVDFTRMTAYLYVKKIINKITNEYD